MSVVVTPATEVVVTPEVVVMNHVIVVVTPVIVVVTPVIVVVTPVTTVALVCVYVVWSSPPIIVDLIIVGPVLPLIAAKVNCCRCRFNGYVVAVNRIFKDRSRFLEVSLHLVCVHDDGLPIVVN